MSFPRGDNNLLYSIQPDIARFFASHTQAGGEIYAGTGKFPTFRTVKTADFVALLLRGRAERLEKRRLLPGNDFVR